MNTGGDGREPSRPVCESQRGPSFSSDRLYFDNASTSFPKPPGVLDAMADFAATIGASAGRGAYRESRLAGDVLRRCRRRLADLFHAEALEHIIFSMNCSEALSLVVHGRLNAAPPVISPTRP